ncbi:MAG: NADH-quinone oxidoreductase subunit NuoE [Erysipelotrichia bacterium]|jgi:NADH-quinone oxidoreductase E subunit|nr:NADH-quinone oxidoreductase subunit NuoE [Erysipelotrichia bacterium]
MLQEGKVHSCSHHSFDHHQAIDQIIDLYNRDRSNLIQILHQIQNIQGFLPLETLRQVAIKLNMPLSEISGVVSFYSFFSTEPQGRHTIRVCLGTACYVRGGKKLIDKLEEYLDIKLGETTSDQRFTFEVARCIGACGLAPAVMIDQDVHRQVNVNKLKSILAKYE